MQRLYEQDILDVLAAPAGATYTFRYDRRYLQGQADTDWESLPGARAVVLYSLQQQREYHEAAFIPIREGVVRKTTRAGSFCFVEFDLGSHLALADATNDDPGGPIRDFAKTLSKLDAPRPYRAWAGLTNGALHGVIDSLNVGTDDTARFAQTCRHLRFTDSFASTRFLAVISLRATGNDVEVKASKGDFVLTAGASYRLEVLHYKPGMADTTAALYRVEADKSVLKLSSPDTFACSSEYDVARIEFTAKDVADSTKTTIALETLADALGPNVKIPILVKPKRAYSRSAIAALLFLVTAVPAVIPSSSKDVDRNLIIVKVLFAVAATLIAFLVFVRRWTPQGGVGAIGSDKG